MKRMIGDPPWRVKGDMLVDAYGTCMFQLVEQPGLADRHKAILGQIVAAPEVMEALLVALPYVEDALDDPAFSRGTVARHVNAIQSVLAKIDEP